MGKAPESREAIVKCVIKIVPSYPVCCAQEDEQAPVVSKER